MKKKAYIRISAAAALLAAGIVTGGMNAAASAVRIGSGTSNSSISSGPLGGRSSTSQTQIVDSNQGIGPVVQEKTLAQTYHSDYQTYELSVDNRWFFYSNVGNGAITDQPVRLEIPSGITYTTMKDGQPYEMDASAPVTEYGTYVMTLTMTEDDSKPFSEQTFLRTTFRFRIQDKPLETAPEGGLDGFGSSSQAADSGWGTSSGMSLDEALAIVNEAGYTVGLETIPEESESGLDGLDDELPPPTEPEEESSAEDADIMGGDGRVDDETLDQTIEELVGPGYGADQIEGFNDLTGLASAFDSTTGYYKHTLASNDAFYTDVPNGMICTNSVTVMTNDEIDFRVLKDGEEIEYTVGAPISEPGSYLVLASQDTSIYASTYYGRKEPVFTFRILNDTVCDLGVYDAPEGAVITGVVCNGRDLDPEWLHDTWAYLGHDGMYTVDMDTEAGPAQISFARDTAAPVFTLETDKSRANVFYRDADAVTCTLMRGRDVVHSGNLVSQVADPGSYTLTVYDAVGNSRSASFRLSYQMNTGAVIAVLLVIVLILAGVIAVRKISRQMKVR